MAFEGYLIKIRGTGTLQDYEFPLKYIEVGTFSCAVHGQALDPFTNTDGITFINALHNVKPKCEFQMLDMTQTELTAIMSQIQARYINSDEKSVNAKIWSGEYGKYIDHKWYVPDIEPVIDCIDVKAKEIYYESIRMAFISVGGPV